MSKVETIRAWQAKHPDRVLAASRRWKARNKERLKAYALQRLAYAHSLLTQCTLCSETASDELLFHHRDPATKLFKVLSGNHSEEALKAEIAKCDVVCKKCHRKIHVRMRRLARIVHFT